MEGRCRRDLSTTKNLLSDNGATLSWIITENFIPVRRGRTLHRKRLKCWSGLGTYVEKDFHIFRLSVALTSSASLRISKISFVWDKRGHVWRENYERLKAFRAKYGHCNATTSKNGGDKPFGMWVTKQKGKYKNWLEGKTSSKDMSLTDEQAALMDEIGFSECVELDRRRLSGTQTFVDSH